MVGGKREKGGGGWVGGGEGVGPRLGVFSPPKKCVRHGGKMQKEMETKAKEAEIASAQAAKAAADAAGAKKAAAPAK